MESKSEEPAPITRTMSGIETTMQAHSGWVLKRGSLNPMYRKRWFNLMYDPVKFWVLVYAKDSSSESSGSIKVVDIVSVRRGDDAHCFMITDIAGRRLKCKCYTVEEASRWMDVLQGKNVTTQGGVADEDPPVEAAPIKHIQLEDPDVKPAGAAVWVHEDKDYEGGLGAAEAKRLADEAEAIRLKKAADDAAAAAAAEAKRLADEAEAKRLADEAEAKRLEGRAIARAEAKRLADEAEAKRLADEAEAKRLADEAEAKRLADQDQGETKDPSGGVADPLNAFSLWLKEIKSAAAYVKAVTWYVGMLAEATTDWRHDGTIEEYHSKSIKAETIRDFITKLADASDTHSLDEPVNATPGIGAATAEIMTKLNIKSCRDLLNKFNSYTGYSIKPEFQ